MNPSNLAKFAVACWLIMAGFATTAAETRLPAPVTVWTNSIPRAFLKDRHLRLYSGVDRERALFRAEWKKPRVAAQAFSYNAVTLKRDKSPPGLPEPESAWREIQVLDVAHTHRLLNGFAPLERAHLSPMGWHTTPVVFPNQALYTNGSNAHGPAVVIARFRLRWDLAHSGEVG